MIKINDYVIYGSHGVCEVINIEKGEDKDYFILKSKSGNSLIKTPINNKGIRHVVTENEVIKLIEDIPMVEPIEIDEKKQRGIKLSELIKTGKCKDLIRVIKTLYPLNEDKAKNKISVFEKELYMTAHKLLTEEFAIALNIPCEEVDSYIQNRIS